jgi:hypothetical protein
MEPARELLELLWRDPRARSRNGNFVRFRDDRRYRTAVKHVRSLISFMGDLALYRGRSDVAVCVRRGGADATVTLRIPALRLRRSLNVSRPELDLLRGDPAWREADVVSIDVEERP